VHGPGCGDRLGPELQRQLQDHGFVFYEADYARALFPRWYRASYQTPDYIRAAAGAWFDVRAHLALGMGGFQDIVILEKPAAGAGVAAPGRKAG
jgi:hypothetical protein